MLYEIGLPSLFLLSWASSLSILKWKRRDQLRRRNRKKIKKEIVGAGIHFSSNSNSLAPTLFLDSSSLFLSFFIILGPTINKGRNCGVGPRNRWKKGREKWRQAVSVRWHISRRLHLPLPLPCVFSFFARAERKGRKRQGRKEEKSRETPKHKPDQS